MAYDNRKFYVGQIETINGSKDVSVNFLEKPRQQTIFYWPGVSDRDNVEASEIFFRQVKVVKESRRKCKVENLQEISTAYDKFSQKYLT